MAVAVRPGRRPLGAAPAVTAGVRLAAWPFVAGIVGVSFVVRTAVGLLRETPIYLGDEYLYAALGRSLAETGRPLVRGHSAHFPALLQPLLTAPAWLAGEVSTGYHLAQTIGALAMSLAAVPTYWLARRLGLSRGVSLAIAAISVALPDLIYASWMVAEPVAYPLVIAAVAAGVAALAAPGRRTQLAFVALAALAAFARIQFIVLPACFLGAILVAGLRERRLRAALREQLLPLVLLAVPVAIALAVGPGRVLAFYSGVTETHVDPVALLGRSGPNLLVLLYASGFVLIPGAILGIALAFGRPRTRAELAFASLTVLLTVSLLVQAGLFGAFDRAQERYLFYVLPLLAIGFGLYASRGWPHRLHHALLACGLIAVAAVVPLAGFAAADEKMHSPLLYGVFWIEERLGTPGSGSLVIALAATVAMLIVAACALRPRLATTVALAFTLLFCTVFSAAAVVFDNESTSDARDSFFGSDPSWVDHAGVGDVALVRNIAGQRGAVFQQLFWNRSIKQLLLMPGAPIVDPFSVGHLRVRTDGSLVMNGRPVTGALLVDEHAVTMRLRGATIAGSAPGFLLYRPAGTPRVSLLVIGRYHDGWLADRGTIALWPAPGSRRIEGTLVFHVETPLQAGSTVRFRLPGGRESEIRVPVGGATVRLPVSSRGPWSADFHSPITGYVGVRPVSVKTSVPRLVPGKCRCTAPVVQPTRAGNTA